MESNKNHGLMRAYIGPYKLLLGLLLLLVIGATGISLANPYILSRFIDTSLASGASRELIKIALLFIGLSIAGQIITISSTFLSQQLAWKATNQLREDLMEHCLGLDPGFHNSKTPGEMIERIDGDVSFLSNFFSNMFVILISSSLLLLGILIALYSVNLWVGICFTVFSFFVLLVFKKTSGVSSQNWVKSREASTNLFSFIEEKLYGVEVVKTNNVTKYVLEKLGKLLKIKMILDRNAFMVSTTIWGTTVVLFSLGTAISLGMGLFFFLKGMMSVGTVFLIYNYSQMIRSPIEQMSNQFQDIQRASSSIYRIKQILNEQSKVRAGSLLLNEGREFSVEFEDVVFEYEHGKPVLNNVSFTIPSGKSLAIIGRTGSGKSTIIKLIFRFIEQRSGVIRINGEDIRSYNLENLRSKIAIITQEVQLFHGTLRDNITFFSDSVSDSEIKRAFQDLGLWDWYCTFPNGLDSQLKSDEMSMSEGEAQLIAMVRIMIKDPCMIIMDEATANLDPVTENLMVAALNKLGEGRSTIIIAHRLQTLRFVDYIMVLQKGEIIEQGLRNTMEDKLLLSYWNSDLGEKGWEL